jgi:hypothetical protein
MELRLIIFVLSVRISSGYYLKTPTNTPLLGPVKSTTSPSLKAASQIEGLFLCAGVSGFGVMCSQAAGEISAGSALEYLKGKGESGEKEEGVKLSWKNRLSATVYKEFDPNFWMDPVMIKKRAGDGTMKTANQL